MKFNDFSYDTQLAILKLRKDIKLKKMIIDYKNNIELSEIEKYEYDKYGIMSISFCDSILIDICRGYLLALGVSRSESYDVQFLIKENNFWVDEK